MCDKASIREPFVQRGTTCLDAGVYAANWLGCGRCGSSALPAAANLRVEEEEDSDDGEAAEETEFEHRCRDCNALVATHFHRFVAGPLARRWLMECALCGRGADERAALAAVAARARPGPAAPPRRALSAAAVAASSDALLARAAATLGVESDDDDDDEWD
ncbi:churchill protein [Aureococcus anophagefferens]|nr:churchill protein [Aureococcus anophagefferens]